MSDFLQSFIFEHSDIRGCIVRLDTSFAEMIQHQNLSDGQQALLAQFVAANLLMSSTIKLDGLLSLQAKTDHQVSMIMAECTDQLHFRGIIRGGEDIDLNDFAQTFKQGTLAITIEPENGSRYQGIVPLEGENLAQCLALYFKQSEQLPSWFYFCQQQGKVAGLMLQALPAQQGSDTEQREEDWQRMVHLASTLNTEEMLTLSTEHLLYRLYHQEALRLFEPRPVQFACTCSRERMERALINLPAHELQDILHSHENLETQCQFCHQRYIFEPADLASLIQSRHVH